MDFPFRVLRFRLVDYIGDEEGATYIRYLLKKKGTFVFTFVEKKGKGYIHTVQTWGINKKDGFGRYYPSQEKACDAMFAWIIGFRVNE